MIVEVDAYPVGPLEALQQNSPIAAQAYLGGALFRLAILQEYALQTNEQRHHEDCRAFAVAAAKTGRAATAALVEINDAPVTAMTFQRDAGGCHRVGDERECWWWHTFSYSVDNIARERARLSTDEKMPTSTCNFSWRKKGHVTLNAFVTNSRKTSCSPVFIP